MPERRNIMDLLNSMRDLGVADPAADRAGEETVRAALAQEIDKASVARRPSRVRWTLARPRLLAGSTLGLAALAAALVLALGGSTASPAFAITKNADGSVLLKLNYATNQNLPQIDAKLAAMGIHESVGIYMASGPAPVSGPVTCAQGPGATTPVQVLNGPNGTEVIKAGESAGNTAEGTFHLARCVVTGDNDSSNTGNTGG
jgi:hypothetical protein